jgi:hypothetical protein
MIPEGALDELASRIETFVRKIILPYEKDARLTDHGPSAALIAELRGHARAAGLLTPHISADGKHMPLRQTAKLFAKAGLSPLGPVAPGYFATDLNRDYFATDAGSALIKRIPQRRLGNLSDLDEPLLLLASEASRFMTGTVIAVDGGHLLSQL